MIYCINLHNTYNVEAVLRILLQECLWGSTICTNICWCCHGVFRPCQHDICCHLWHPRLLVTSAPRVWTDCRSAAWHCSGWARPWWWCSRPWGRWCSSTICMGIREGGNSSGLLVLFQYHGGWQNSKKLEAKVGWGQDSCATMFLRRGNLTQNTIENSLGYAAQFLWYLKAKFHLHGRKVLMKREC